MRVIAKLGIITIGLAGISNAGEPAGPSPLPPGLSVMDQIPDMCVSHAEFADVMRSIDSDGQLEQPDKNTVTEEVKSTFARLKSSSD